MREEAGEARIERVLMRMCPLAGNASSREERGGCIKQRSKPAPIHGASCVSVRRPGSRRNRRRPLCDDRHDCRPVKSAHPWCGNKLLPSGHASRHDPDQAHDRNHGCAARLPENQGAPWRAEARTRADICRPLDENASLKKYNGTHPRESTSSSAFYFPYPGAFSIAACSVQE